MTFSLNITQMKVCTLAYLILKMSIFSPPPIFFSVEQSTSHALPYGPINYSQVMCSSFNQTSFTLSQPPFPLYYLYIIIALASNPLLFRPLRLCRSHFSASHRTHISTKNLRLVLQHASLTSNKCVRSVGLSCTLVPQSLIYN